MSSLPAPGYGSNQQQPHHGSYEDPAVAAASAAAEGNSPAAGAHQESQQSQQQQQQQQHAAAAVVGNPSTGGNSNSNAFAVDLARDLWKPLNPNQIRDMLEELSNLIRSYPSCLGQPLFEPLRDLITDAIHYPRRYIRPDGSVLESVRNKVLLAPTPGVVVAGPDAASAAASTAKNPPPPAAAAAANAAAANNTAAATPASDGAAAGGGATDAGGDGDVGGYDYGSRGANRRKNRARPKEAVTAAAVAAIQQNAQQQQEEAYAAGVGAGEGEEESGNPEGENFAMANDHQQHPPQYHHDGDAYEDARQLEQEQPERKRRKTIHDRHSAGGVGATTMAMAGGGGGGQQQQGGGGSGNYMAENTLHEVPRVVCDRYTSSWNTRFDELEQFRIRYGHTNVPKHYEPSPSLGRWVGRQREQYQLWRSGRTTQLTQERANRLSSLGFIWDAQQAAWEIKLKELEEYRNQHGGDCNVPIQFPENKALAIWCNTQRKQKKNLDLGKTSSMTPARIRALDALGFSWGNTHVPFDDRVKELEAFMKANSGSCDVPRDYPPNQPLATWASNMRKEYQKFKNGNPKACINQARIDTLNAMGFRWEQPDRWMVRYLQLLAYRKKWGTTNVPNKVAKLGAWARYQRMQKKAIDEGKPATLTPERIKLLEDIDFNFSEGDNSFEFRLQELKGFKKYFGHVNVPDDHPTLANFVKNQRKLYHQRGKKNFASASLYLTDERVQELESLGFDWGDDSIDDEKGGNSGSNKKKRKKDNSTTK